MQISHNKIDLILQEEDIEGHIADGAPKDEYASEALEIANALSLLTKEQFVEENILAIISLVWARSFNLEKDDINLRLPAFRKVIKRLI